MTKSLVTGATGFIGANLVRRLLRDGHEVYALTRESSDWTRLEALRDQIRTVQCLVTDTNAVAETIRKVKPDLVFHLASTRFNPPVKPSVHLDVNVLGTLNILESLQALPDTRLIFSGSTAAYGSGAHMSEDLPFLPGSVFGASKASASILMQTYVRLYGLHAVELRLFTPYGPWESAKRLIPHTILSALAGNDIALTSGEQERDFIFVDDVVDAMITAATVDIAPGTVINIGSGSGTSVKNVTSTILELMGNPVEILLGSLPTRSDEIMTMSANITSAHKILRWTPRTDLTDGLVKTIAWFTKNRESAETLP